MTIAFAEFRYAAAFLGFSDVSFRIIVVVPFRVLGFSAGAIIGFFISPSRLLVYYCYSDSLRGFTSSTLREPKRLVF